jgi:branched-chain amino acid transport system permease protein
MEPLLVSGITVGCVYAIIALSFAPSFSSSSIVNFGQGELVMLGAMVGAVMVGSAGVPYFLAIPVVAVVTMVASLLMYLLVVRAIRRRGGTLITQILGTLAAGILIRVAVSFALGITARRLPAPFSDRPVSIGPLEVPPQSLVIVGGVAVVLVAMWLLYTRTLFGLTIRATALRRDVAQLVGIDVDRLTAITFLLGGALAGVAGMLYGPLVNATPWSGLQFALWGFMALIIGGLGSWWGPVLAGILLGLTEAFARSALGSGYGEGVTILLMLAFLYLRPTGLMGAPDVVRHAA